MTHSNSDAIVLEIAKQISSFTEDEFPIRYGNDNQASAFDLTWDMALSIRSKAADIIKSQGGIHCTHCNDTGKVWAKPGLINCVDCV